LIRSLPLRSASGLPVYVAASRTAPFSTLAQFTLSEVEGLEMTRFSFPKHGKGNRLA
jgi:hypothetical protein